jgi:chemotaxis family two-component system response regulator Rcp1
MPVTPAALVLEEWITPPPNALILLVEDNAINSQMLGDYKEYMMKHSPHIQPIEILVVDDNPSEVQLIIEAFQDAKLSHQLHSAGDGVAALAFLRRERPYQGEPRPDLIILDLNIPKIDGHTVLQEIKADPTLRQIPVVVLSTSRTDEDIHRAYDLHANCFITKPVEFAQFVTVAQAIDMFWFAIVTLPPKRPGRS